MLKLGVGAAALVMAASFYGTRPSGDPGDPAHVAAFKTQCQRAVRGSNAKPFCRCLMTRALSTLQTPDEHALAAGIVTVISNAASNSKTLRMDEKATKNVIQHRFSELSQEFHTRVSISRKATVLQLVTTGLKICAPELERKAV